MTEGEAGVWIWRDLAGGWRVGHRVVLQGKTPVIAETHVRAQDDQQLPIGGLGSDDLRRVTVRGIREVAEARLRAKGTRPVGDLRRLEGLSPSAKRHGEAKRWNLALTSWAYVRALQEGSRHPNEDAAAALGVTTLTVRDRIHAARQEDPPLLTGGGRKGVIGTPELTEAGQRALDERLTRILAALGIAPGQGSVLRLEGTLALFTAMNRALLHDAELRIPGFWQLSPEEIAHAVSTNPPEMTYVPAGKGVQIGPEGTRIVDVDKHGRPR